MNKNKEEKKVIPTHSINTFNNNNNNSIPGNVYNIILRF